MNKQQIIESMCMTWRHDFGLNKSGNCRFSSGMTEPERDVLRQQMESIYEHHIRPLQQATALTTASVSQASDDLAMQGDGALNLVALSECEELIASLPDAPVVAYLSRNESSARTLDELSASRLSDYPVPLVKLEILNQYVAILGRKLEDVIKRRDE